MEGHDHEFVFTRDLRILDKVAHDLDWPDDVEERIDQVQRCECGALNRVAWTGRRGRENEIPAWLIDRLLAHKRQHEHED